jgi:hypothetical protein
VRPFLVYTAARTLLVFAAAALLYAVGLRGFLLVLFALVLSLPLSYLLLARQRRAFGADVERRLADRQARTATLRARLRGEADDPAGDPAGEAADPQGAPTPPPT